MVRQYQTFYFCTECRKEIKEDSLGSICKYDSLGYKMLDNKTVLKLWHNSRDYDGYPCMCGPIELRHDQDIEKLEFRAIGDLI